MHWENEIRVTENLRATSPPNDVVFSENSEKLAFRRHITVATDLAHAVASLLGRKIVRHSLTTYLRSRQQLSSLTFRPAALCLLVDPSTHATQP